MCRMSTLTPAFLTKKTASSLVGLFARMSARAKPDPGRVLDWGSLSFDGFCMNHSRCYFSQNFSQNFSQHGLWQTPWLASSISAWLSLWH
jgi:hypothetical protein